MRDDWIVSTLGLFSVMLSRTFAYKPVRRRVCSLLLGGYLGVELLGHVIKVMYAFLRNYCPVGGRGENSTRHLDWWGQQPRCLRSGLEGIQSQDSHCKRLVYLESRRGRRRELHKE